MRRKTVSRDVDEAWPVEPVLFRARHTSEGRQGRIVWCALMENGEVMLT